ncbi:MAG: GTPase, partial [Alphaproteobacteria bacterium]|nr:GTPase [Alphaproteobacteria bacterium]
MRLKTFTAPSMTDALRMVKDHFGDDAIIVSSQKGDGGLGVNITAAVDRKESIDSLNHHPPSN